MVWVPYSICLYAPVEPSGFSIGISILFLRFAFPTFSSNAVFFFLIFFLFQSLNVTCHLQYLTIFILFGCNLFLYQTDPGTLLVSSYPTKHSFYYLADGFLTFLHWMIQAIFDMRSLKQMFINSAGILDCCSWILKCGQAEFLCLFICFVLKLGLH